MSDWLIDEVLGPGRLEPMIREFYDTLFDDIIVGFLFQPHDKEALIQSQQRWLRGHLGQRAEKWEGPSIRQAHVHLPILSGQFDRRHQVLVELLEKWDVPEHVCDEWLELDLALRPLVLNLGAVERDRIIDSDPKK